MQIAVGGGVESISLVQNDKMNRFRVADPWLVKNIPQIYMTMIETAEIVAERYGVSREAQDEYSLQSQQRTAKAQAEGRFNAEIAPLTSIMTVTDKETGATSEKEVTLKLDEGNRPQDDARGPAEAAAGVQGWPAHQGRPVHHRRQCLAAVGRRRGTGADGSEGSREARPQAARRVSRHDGRGLRSGRNGHRPGVRRAEAAEGSTA